MFFGKGRGNLILYTPSPRRASRIHWCQHARAPSSEPPFWAGPSRCRAWGLMRPSWALSGQPCLFRRPVERGQERYEPGIESAIQELVFPSGEACLDLGANMASGLPTRVRAPLRRRQSPGPLARLLTGTLDGWWKIPVSAGLDLWMAPFGHQKGGLRHLSSCLR